jgi:ELWxxDGT repeat protein
MKRLIPACAPLFSLCLLASPLAAAPHLVRDLNTGVNGEPQPIELGNFSTSPGRTIVYFPGSDPDHGTELWQSDGTRAGTRRVTDICPGRCGSRPGPVTTVSGQLFFSADDGVSGSELWRSDGTPGSERRVRDLCTGPCGSIASGVAALGGRTLFVAKDGARRVLWSTNGARRGTVEVAALCTVSSLGDCVLFGDGQRIGGWVFFLVFDASRNSELWRTDGTPEGTGPLRDVVPGGEFQNTGPVFPAGPAAARGFFWTRDTLWTTDGTPAGTVAIKNIKDLQEDPSELSFPGPTAVWNGELYTFLSTGEIVRSDATPAGTVRFARLGPDARVSEVVPTPTDLFFSALDPIDTPNQVWRTRGTADTTVRLLYARGNFLSSQSFAAAGNRLVFALSNDTIGDSAMDLWASDGTADGTVKISDNLQDYYGPSIVSLGSIALLAKGTSNGDFSGTVYDQLWRTDGTAAGTRPVRNFTTAVPGGAGPIHQTVLGSRLVYSGWADRVAPTMLSSDGTALGTRVLRNDARWPDNLLTVGPRAFFSTGEALGTARDLWATDGTPAGTRQLVPGLASLRSFSALGNLLLFAAQRSGTFEEMGAELWRSDGTAAGSRLVLDIDPFQVGGPHHSCIGESSSPSAGVALGNFLIFAADDGRYGRELWRSNGTADGTRRVRDINTGRDPFPPDSEQCNDRTSRGRPSNPEGFVRYRNLVLFTADDGATGRELWATDGSEDGTQRVRDLRPGVGGSAPHDLTVFRQYAYFFAAEDGVGGSGDSLWRTDGTAAGTVRVHDLTVNGTPSWARSLTVAGNRLFFSVYNEVTGAELWASDGTHTYLVKDLRPGAPSSTPQDLAAAGNVLVFAADDGIHGLEPWRSDGTAAGTRRLGDIYPGRNASSPGPFSVLRDDILTGADDGAHGRELWAIPVADASR